MDGNTAIHDGTSTAGMDTSKGLVSALGGQDMHPMQFIGAEIQPVQSGSSIALQEQGGWGLRTWASHPSAIGYRRRGQFGGGVGGSGSGGGGGSGSSVVVIPAVSPEFDSGMNDGTDGQELERLENFYSGAEENPTSAQSAPTPRAEQQVSGAGAAGGPSLNDIKDPYLPSGPTWIYGRDGTTPPPGWVFLGTDSEGNAVYGPPSDDGDDDDDDPGNAASPGPGPGSSSNVDPLTALAVLAVVLASGSQVNPSQPAPEPDADGSAIVGADDDPEGGASSDDDTPSAPTTPGTPPAAAAGSQVRPAQSAPQHATGGGVLGYGYNAVQQAFKGNYTPDDQRNLAGTAGEIGVGFVPIVGSIASARDAFYDVTNWKWTWGHALQTGADAAGLIPFVRGFAKGGGAAIRGLRGGTEVVQAATRAEGAVARTLGKVDDAADLAKGGRAADDLGAGIRAPSSPLGARGPISGREFDLAAAGGPIRQLTTGRIKITSQGIDVVEQHLGRFVPDAANQGMIQRLRDIADGKLQPTQADLNFYSHELREFVRYRQLGWRTGTPGDLDAAHELWNNAHAATLEDYGLREGPGVLYHPSVEP